MGNGTYAEQGYVSPNRVLSEETAKTLYDKVLEIRANPSANETNYLDSNTHMLFPDLYDLVGKKEVLDHVEKAIGPNILCWTASFFNKEAHDPHYVTWHQDLTYWGLEPPDIVTAWIALTPSTPENGCMRVIPGSHLKGKFAHTDTFSEHNLLSRGQMIKADVGENKAVDIVLRPGEMSLHHVMLVHGSEPNPSPIPRYGFVVRYIPTYCKQIGGRTAAMLVRGSDQYNHFDSVPRPQSDLHPDALDFRRRANASLDAIRFDGT